MRVSRHWMVFAVTLAAACGGNTDDGLPAGPAATLEARQGETFRLRAGQTARVAGLYVGFRGITADSRCPGDVVCVWQGDASARIQVGTSATGGTAYELHTMLSPQSIEYEGRAVTLVLVEPYPVTSRPIDPATYVIMLRVD